MKISWLLYSGLVWAFIIIVPIIQAQSNRNATLHESLGEVIDAQENHLFNIFGDIIGFAAARFYLDRGAYCLHILRNTDSGAQVLIQNMNVDTFTQLQTNMSVRIATLQKQKVQFDQTLYSIEESKWQEKSRNKNLILHDGSQLVGILQRAQHDTLVMQTLTGIQIPVPDLQIAKIVDSRSEINEGKLLRLDPNTSRLFFAPTGRQLKGGSGYFADYFIFFPTLAYGITDHFSLSGGVSLIPGASSQVLYFAPKLTWSVSPKVGLATGFLYLRIPEEGDDLNLGYLVTTIGSARSGITLGTGLPLNANAEQNPILLIGGEAQISNSAKFITENWIFTGDDGVFVLSGGIRFFGDRLAVDLALLTSDEAFDGEGFPFVPWVDFSVFFGK